jgi:tetrapyrrole methylase family protein/MazG family protein
LAIREFAADNKRAPQSLQEVVDERYLRSIRWRGKEIGILVPLVKPVRDDVECSVRGEVGAARSRMAATRKKLSKQRKTKRSGTPVQAVVRANAEARGPHDAAEWFGKLVAVQGRLRAPGGCPWDREQTHASLRTYLIEEAYEVLEALEAGDDAKFADELGDLLLQVLFHADIAREDGRFDVVDVIRAIHDKMIRRHPHVFGDVNVKDSAEVLKNWDRIKAEERKAAAGGATRGHKAPSVLDGVTRGLPATMEGFQLTRKAARIGFDWDSAHGVLEKVREESAEVDRLLDSANQWEVEEEVGDLLFAVVNLARFLKIDPEIALKRANGKFAARFHAMEAMARQRGGELPGVPRDEMEKYWELAKGNEKRGKVQRPAIKGSPARA